MHPIRWVSWYALRFWIELGFKALKSLGWEVGQDAAHRPTRVSRHWLVLSVATLLALAYGTRVEDAQERRIAPGNLRAPPKALAPNHRDPWSRPARTVSVIRHGIDWLRRLLLKGASGAASGCCPNPGQNPSSTWPDYSLCPTVKTLYLPLSGKIPTTSVRRRISLFNRSSGLLDQSFCQWGTGKAVKARVSGKASSSI